MELQFQHTACDEPQMADMVGPYCFDELDDADRAKFEAHLLACERCWSQVRRLGQHVEVLESDRRLADVALTPETIGVLGVSGALDLPFGGHRVFAITSSVLLALLLAVPVVVEVAYQFDRFGRLAMTLAPVVFTSMLVANLATFWLGAREARAGTAAFWKLLLLQGAATACLCLALLPLLPVAPTVEANFQTYPVRLGYLKSGFYAWLVGPWLIFWPFHFVLSMQGQLALAKHKYVLNVLDRAKAVVPPRGLPFVPAWVMGCYVVGLFVFNWIGVSHLFDNLRPSPNMALFMTAVLIRVTAWLSLAALGTLWYWTNLTELKRECLAVLPLARRRSEGADARSLEGGSSSPRT